jgi:hypothetical protein
MDFYSLLHQILWGNPAVKQSQGLQGPDGPQQQHPLNQLFYQNPQLAQQMYQQMLQQQQQQQQQQQSVAQWFTNQRKM